MSQTHKIAKNATVLFGSQIMMWLLTMIITIVLPRYLGAVGMGKIQFATSLWMMVGVITAFGTDLLLTKEIARDPARTPRLFGSALVLRFGLFVIGYAVTIALLYGFHYPADTITVVCLIGIANLIRQCIAVAQATLQGLERMEFSALGEIVGNALYTLFGITLLLTGWSIYAIAALLILTTSVNLVIQLFFLNRLYTLRLNFAWSPARALFQEGWPYLLSSFFLVAYLQVDILAISAFVDEAAIGWYSAASRLFGTFLFIPTVYITAAFPVFSRMFVDDQSGLNRLISKSFDTLLLLSVPIGLGLMVLANPLVRLIFGAEFANSGSILAVLGIVVVLTYQNILIGRFLISMDRQNAWTWVMAVATIATVPLDMVLIPWCQATFSNGALGGAFSFVLTELGMLVVGLILLPAGALTRANLWIACRVLLAGLLMAAVVRQFEDLWLAIPILLGVVTYVAAVFVLRIIPKEDIELVQGLSQSLLTKFRRPQPEAVNS